MKKKVRHFFAVLVFAIMSFSVHAMAGTTGYVPGKFGELWISCRISCTSSRGTADTKGAPYGYKNVANIIIRNNSGVALGSNSNTTPYTIPATATATGSGVKSALSGHYVLDSDGNPAQPLYMQVNLEETP